MLSQIVNITRPLRRKAREKVLKISLGIMPIQPRRLDNLMIAAAGFPLRSDPTKSQFLRLRAHGRIWFSAQLLSMGAASSLRWRDSAAQRFRL